MGHHKITVTLTFELGPPKSNQFILEPKSTFVPILHKFSQSVFDISCSKDTMDKQPKNTTIPAKIAADAKA